MWKDRRLMAPEDDGGTGGAPAPAPAPGPAPSPAPAPGPAPSPSPSPAPSPAPAPGPAPAPAPEEAKGFWPDNWRETVSKDDAKMLTRLQRYGSPADVAKALVAAQNRISSGELLPVLKKDATAEQIKEYREAVGIPEAPDKYDLKGLKVEEADKPLVDMILTAAHTTNQTPEQAAASVKTFQQIRTQALEKQAEKDAQQQVSGEDDLRAEWGADYRRNLNLIHSTLDSSGSQDLKDKVLLGRLSDGTRIGNSPEALRMLLGVALMQNPTGVVVPSGVDQVKGVNDEIAEIEKFMQTDRKAYNKDEKKQARLRDLYAAREKLKPREAA